MTEEKPSEIPVCPKCGRKTIYFRKNGSIRCTACGYDSDAIAKFGVTCPKCNKKVINIARSGQFSCDHCGYETTVEEFEINKNGSIMIMTKIQKPKDEDKK